VIVVRGSIVREYTAKSQSVAAMNKQDSSARKRTCWNTRGDAWGAPGELSKQRPPDRQEPPVDDGYERTERFKSMTSEISRHRSVSAV